MVPTRIVRADSKRRVNLHGMVEPFKSYKAEVDQAGRIVLTPLERERVESGEVE